MDKRQLLTVLLLPLLFHGSGRLHAQEPPINDPWWIAGQTELNRRLAVKPNKVRAKNVILFIGDGMGISTLTAMRIYDGQSRGESGEENIMPYEGFPHSALIKTYNTNAQVADSAGTASAIMTGVKTRIGAINMSADHSVGVCKGWQAQTRMTFAEKAAMTGKAVGVVSTARLTHATPASVYAHSPTRDWEDDTELTEEARENGCVDIAAQMIAFPHGGGLTVAMGGGRRSFLPKGTSEDGRRNDGRDLAQEWANGSNRAAYVTTKAELDALDMDETDRILGLFAPSHMAYELDREAESPNEPSLADMTNAALDRLEQDEDGYFLMVEGGRIDHAHHGGNAARALKDGQAFAQAVATAVRRVDLDETLILVTADHSHVFTIAGYPARGNPILGLVSAPDGDEAGEIVKAADGKPYTTLGYWTGPGALQGSRPPLSMEKVLDPDYLQQAAIALRSETHGGEDVALFAIGPWSHLVGGVLEQNTIYHIMDHATGLSGNR